ncbi:MAG: hypothetical protein JO061_04820 [Acidobacteriaceae bacterium]|nr:hypothetical protein [Acidobacteriaceae bacterium]
MSKQFIAVAFLVTASFAASGAVTVQKVAWKGWKNCYRVSNGDIELIVTSDVGPRIMRFGFVGGQNLFKEFSDQLGGTGEAKFQLRGGHRVWKAPEDPIATWAPDNVPVEIQITADGLIAREPVEPLTHLQKELAVRMGSSGTVVTVTNQITNKGLFPLEFSTWALTMMAPGGRAITGFPPRGRHPINLQATNPLVMWAYTDLSDSRLKFTKKYLILRQDPNNHEAEKVGLFNTNTWVAYVLNNEAFVKQYRADTSKTYPDFGCSFETFTNNEFLEIETLGFLTKVQPGQSISHLEQWSLHKSIAIPALTDSELDRVILPLLR